MPFTSTHDQTPRRGAIRAALARAGLWTLLILLPLSIFWRADFFFIYDDWTELFAMSSQTWAQYVTGVNGEIWFPVFRAAFLPVVELFRDAYGLYVALNCVLLGVTAILLESLLRRHVPAGVSATLAVFFLFSPVHGVIVWNAFYLCYLMSMVFLLAAALCVHAYAGSGRTGWLAAAGVSGLLAATSHPYALFALFSLPVYALAAGGSPRQALHVLGAACAVGALYVGAYLGFAGISRVNFLAPESGPASSAADFLTHLLYGSFLSPFARALYFSDPESFWTERALPLAAFCVVLGHVLCFAPRRLRLLALWGVAFNATSFALVTLARHQLFVDQALSSRYGFFSWVGILAVFAAWWAMLLRMDIDRIMRVYIPLAALVAVAVSTLAVHPILDGHYTTMSRINRMAFQGFRPEGNYQGMSADDAANALVHPELRVFTRSQADGLRDFLRRP